MAEIAGVTIDFTDYVLAMDPRTINIPDAAGDVTVQDLIDTLSAQQAELDNLIYAGLMVNADTAGKQTLSATKQVGLTLTLNHAQVKFPDQPGPAWVIKRVTDGNMVAVDNVAAELEPLASSNFTNWKNEADVSAALVSDGFSAADQAFLAALHQHAYGRLEMDFAAQELVLYATNGITVLQRWAVATDGGETVKAQEDIQTKRGAPIL